MKRENTGLCALILAVFLSALTPLCAAPSDYTYSADPDHSIYFGHISYVDIREDGFDPVVIREGVAFEEKALLNFPVAPGDTIRTSEKRRCEIQFDTGTIIRMDKSTELKIITVLAPSLSSRYRITNLELSRGRLYLMYKRYNQPEIFELKTPSAAAKIGHGAVVLLEYDGKESLMQVKRGKSSLIYGPDEAGLKMIKIKGGKAIRITEDHQAVKQAFAPEEDFWRWNMEINADFDVLHEGLTPIPKPIYRYPRAVIEFAEKWSHPHGEWMYDDLYGYVWRPYYNDYYPYGVWRPYYFGQWRLLDGQLFWVPQESWGWVPFHLGLWTWNENKGWIWIPGSAFAPAWVAWSFFRGFLAWRPWGLMDWYLYGPYYSSMDVYGGLGGMNPLFWNTYGSYLKGGTGPGDEPPGGDSPGRPILTSINRGQLKKRIKGAPYPLPKTIKSVLNRVTDRVKAGDKKALQALRALPEQAAVLPMTALGRPRLQDHIRPFGALSEDQKRDFFKPMGGLDQTKSAAALYRISRDSFAVPRIMETVGPRGRREGAGFPPPGKDRGRGDAAAQAVSSSGSVKNDPAVLSRPSLGRIPAAGPSRGFRDWNPDVALARRAGVSILYSPAKNEIVCPELSLSSRDVSRARNMSVRTGITGGSFRSFASGSGSGSGSGGSGGYVGGSGGAASSSAGTSRSSGSSSRSGSTGRK
jgi:hypothetical protein